MLAIANRAFTDKPRIAVLGDSMAAQSALYDEMWPEILSRNLNQNGVPCELRSFSINAHTAFRALNTPAYGTLTSYAALVRYNPSLVIVSLGFNDAWSKVDSRSSGQVNTDIQTLLTSLRAALPGSLIYFAAQGAYDNVNFVPAALRNKGAPPQSWNLSTAGILQNFYTPEFLETLVTAGTVTSATDYNSYITAAQASGAINGSFNLNAWKIARLGNLSSDGLHFTRYGHTLLAGACLKGLLAQSTFTSSTGLNYSSQLIPSWADPDVVFSENLTTSGTGYVTAIPPTSNSEVPTTNQSIARTVLPDLWFYPYKATSYLRSVSNPSGATVSITSTSATGLYTWGFVGAAPNSLIFLSVDGGAFFSSGESTNNKGDFNSVALMQPLAAALGLTTGARVFRFLVGVSVFGPFTLNLTT